VKRIGETKMRTKKRLITAITALVLIAALAVPVLSPTPALADEASIWTDKENYAPDETVTIFGSGFNASAVVTIDIEAPDFSVDTIDAWTDSSGDFSARYLLNGQEGTYTVTATDGRNTATTTFTDAIKIKTYKDAAYSIVKEYFIRGDTVYAKATGLIPSKSYKIEWFDPSDISVKATVYGTGAYFRVDSYTLSTGAPLGDWKVKVYESGSWKFKADATFHVEIHIDTYKDAACTEEETCFRQGDMVYANATGLDNSKCYKIEWFNPSDVSVQATVYGAGITSQIDSYTLPPDATIGDWTVKVYEGDTATGPWTEKGTNTFYVWHQIAPIADSWVKSTSDGDDNYGEDTKLHVKVKWDGKHSKVDELRRSYLKFDLSGLPACTVIDSAILHLYRTDDYDIPSAYSTTDGWTEMGITWNNQPGPGAFVANGVSEGSNWYGWNVTSYAASEFAGDEILSILMKFTTESGSDQHFDFTSREGRCNHRPWLEISYHSGPGPDCTITASSPVCAVSTGNTASVPAAGMGATYDWSITGNGTLASGQNTTSITWDAGAAGTTTISVTVEDANGCSSNCTKQVEVVAPCVATAPGFSICVGTTLDDNLFLSKGANCTGPACCNITLDYSEVTANINSPGTYSYNATCGYPDSPCPPDTATGYVTVVEACNATAPDFSICVGTTLDDNLFLSKGANCTGPACCNITLD